MSVSSDLIGEKIDDYRIVGILGQGGMGVVYKAEDVGLERTVALKVMDERFTSDPILLERFRLEARALAKLDVANIVKVYALRETKIGFCLVMEFVEGETLQERLRRSGALPTNEVVGVFLQILLGLSHAHRSNVIHRDLKPSNIMITSLGTAKITDFGLAKIQRPSDASKTIAVAGTVYYMSPEQITGLGNVDVRGDIYSLGMTMYEAAAGRLPFSTQDSDFAIQLIISQGKVPPVRKVNATVPRDLESVIEKAIETNPAKRYQTADEMLKALQQVQLIETVDLDRTVVYKKPSVRPSVPKPRRRWEWIAIPGVVLVAAILVLTYVLFPSGPSLSVETDPTGASVYVEGRPVGMTPLEGIRAQVGRSRVQINYEGFLSRDTVLTLTERQTMHVFIPLVKSPETEHLLTVRTSPDRALVYLDNLYLGTTPVIQSKIKRGRHHLRIDKQSYASRDTDLVIQGGDKPDLMFSLETTAQGVGQVTISVTPEDAVVYVDNKAVARRDLKRFELEVGRHSVRVVHNDFQERTDVLNVLPGEIALKHYALVPRERFGKLNISAGPENAEILIDNFRRGKTPRLLDNIPTGSHIVRLEHSRLGTWIDTLQVELDVTMSVVVDFNKTYTVRILCFDEANNAIRNGEIFVDDHPVDNPVTPFPVQVRTGLRKIQVRAQGFVSQSRKINFDDQAPDRIRFTLPKSK